MSGEWQRYIAIREGNVRTRETRTVAIIDDQEAVKSISTIVAARLGDVGPSGLGLGSPSPSIKVSACD